MTDPTFAQRWDGELFGVQRSVRYHARRQAFYDFWNTFTNAVSIIGGAGTVWVFLDKAASVEWRLWLPAIITIVSTLNLLWGTSRQARTHNDLYRRFVELERDMVGIAQPNEDDLKEVKGRRLMIEADEPPIKFAVDVLCHNELVRALGSDEYRRVPWWQKWFAHFFSFPNAKFDQLTKKSELHHPTA
jgi:hypothetical protein